MEKDPRFIDGHQMTLSNMTVDFAYLFKADDKFGDPVWKINIRLPKGLAEEMKGLGFNVKLRKDENGNPIEDAYFITAKRKTRTREGKPMTPPTVVDSGAGKPEPEQWPEHKAIGNGSVCNIKCSAKYVEAAGRTFLPLYLDGVQVIKHVPYGDVGFSSVDEGGL